MKRLLFILPGPEMAIKRSRFENMSKCFEGDIITSSARDNIINTKMVGGFTYNCLKYNYSHKIYFNIKYLLYILFFSIKSRIKRKKYDLVVTYDPLRSGLIGALSAFILKAKFAPEVNGVYTAEAEWLDDADRLITKLKKKIYPIMMYFVLKRADGIKLLFNCQIDPFKKIVNGKIIRSFSSLVAIGNFKNIKEEKEVLFVGYPFKRKGVDILIMAFKKIASNYPDWQLKIIGMLSGTAELNKAIAGHPQIHYHKPVDPIEMPQHIGSCGIFALPSLSEAMGRVLVETMAAGKPRIGSNVDGIPTVIDDGVDGVLVEPGNVDDLAEKLDLLMSNPGLRNKLGKNGEIRAKKEFTEDVYFKNLENFYNDVIAKK